uniref:PHD-type domain-containing protein n=1 Tax=Chenopodium quinoa TaxID=63459 RepID=A0A803N5V8_CHEQI
MGEREICVLLALPCYNAENPKKVGNELKRELGCVVNEAELGALPRKKHAKEEALNTNCDDITSEVLDPIRPIVSSKFEIDDGNEIENVSSLETTTCSLPVELGGSRNNNNIVNPDEITSENSGNSCAVSCSDEVTRVRGCTGVSSSQVTLEIPEHASTTGIRKITLKFSMSKKEHENKLLPLTPRVLSNGLHDGDSIIDSNDEVGLDDSTYRFPYNMELKMSKKVIPDSYPTNVKKLLSTGILEGARVKYISTSGAKEILGEIRGCGYLCGCSVCNFTNVSYLHYMVLSAYEFEQHAGGAKTRHPNNHIFLENGRPIYSIIEELKTAPLGMLEEVVTDMAGSSVNQAWKVNLQPCNQLVSTERKYKKSASFPLSHPRSNDSTSFVTGSHKRSFEGGVKKRDNDLHRLLFLPNGLPDGAYLAYYAKGQKILDGYKQGNGIVCGHCEYEISPSQFEAHAGWAARRQPYRNIYTANGLTLHDIAMSLANGQKLTTGNNDDMCTLCGDRGELIPCGGCPRAYHPTCLHLQSAPTDDWRCPDCNDRKADVASSSSTKPIIIRLTRVVKNSETLSGGCILCRADDFSVDNFDDRTVIICDQCEKEYHVGCLRGDGRCDLKELPKDKWFCCNDCDKIYAALRDLVVRGSGLIPSLELIKINRKLLEKGLSEVANNDIQWRILSGKCRRPEHLPSLSTAVSIFRECFSPITAKTGRDLIPVMVHGSVVVSAGLLRIFGREVAELPLVATSKEYQGKGYFLALFSRIEKLLCALEVKNLVLPAADKAKFMWVNKLGFRDVSQERLSLYTSDFQLTEFSGTVMLEKNVEGVMHESGVSSGLLKLS